MGAIPGVVAPQGWQPRGRVQSAVLIGVAWRGAADAGTRSRDAPIAVFIQIVSRQLQTLRGPPSPDPHRGAEPVNSDSIIIVRIRLGRGDAGAGWDGMGGFARGRPAGHPLPFPPAHSRRESKCGCMDAAAPPEHPGANAGGRRSWPGSVPLPALHPHPAVLFISPAVRTLWGSPCRWALAEVRLHHTPGPRSPRAGGRCSRVAR